MLRSIGTMQRTRIKICGVTHPDDALAASRAGADAIGIVFHPPSKRNVHPNDARKIVSVLPPFVTSVGVFMNTPADEALRVATGVGLRAVQLHGNEPHDDIAVLNPLPVLKTIHVERPTMGDVLQIWKAAIEVHNLWNLTGFVLESSGSAGGSGVENDWATIKEAQTAGAFDNLPPLVAAGGLKPENVGKIVREIRPWAVDVSSGVEAGQVGRKSRERIEAFVREVRQADMPAATSTSAGCLTSHGLL